MQVATLEQITRDDRVRCVRLSIITYEAPKGFVRLYQLTDPSVVEICKFKKLLAF